MGTEIVISLNSRKAAVALLEGQADAALAINQEETMMDAGNRNVDASME